MLVAFVEVATDGFEPVLMGNFESVGGRPDFKKLAARLARQFGDWV